MTFEGIRWSNTAYNRSRPVALNYSKISRSQYFERASLYNVSVSKDLATAAFAPLKGGLVVSCQAPNGTAIDTPEFIAAQSLTVIQAGAVGIRAQGIANVAAVAKVTEVPIIGLVKRYLDDTPVYITPILNDVLELEAAGASIVAIDATERVRSGGVTLEKFMAEIRAVTKVPILADVDSIEAGLIAESLGCEAIATTLSGYTDKAAPKLPNLELVEQLAKKIKVPIVAEGGFNRPEQVVQAFNAGAWTVCVGTAITNPYLLTKSFIEAFN